MKKVICLACLCIVFYSLSAQDERPASFTLSISMENAFGFYPALYGSFGIGESTDFTYYGLFWTNPSFGQPASTYSSDLWLEQGFGIGFDGLNGTAYFNPSLGFTHGKFLSGGTESVLFDGIVPSIIAYFYPGTFDGEFYLGLYQHFRDESNGTNTYDFLFYYMYPGFWVSDRISLGVHYEEVYLNYASTGLESAYRWVGPFIKITEAQKFTFRFSGGVNLQDNTNYPYSGEFYKLSVLIPLL